ncbi:MAG: DoxX family protein [Acidimicrobiia bacterium]|nr:DoxX family protein [Acidimicrobiia bacterium]MBV9039825.1 DoxX family protein [Acidimicrobiia bacterium]MBV9285294.1 DoxX family protein [Acidimicrobiia bacterium]
MLIRLTRRIARPLLAGIFVQGGLDTFRNPGPRAQRIEPVMAKVGDAVPLPDDTVSLVRFNAAVHVVAGTLLAMGRVPRLAAAVLAASLVPTTVAGHRFWEEDSPQSKAMQRTHFLKNLAILGGLIVTATERR